MAYIRDYATDMAYIQLPKLRESPTGFRKRVFTTLVTM
jgi:hypothetical protein